MKTQNLVLALLVSATLAACSSYETRAAAPAMVSAGMLTGANGMTLYTFDKDTAGVSNCYDKCATNWPPLFATADTKAEGDFTIIDRKDATKIVAYKGWPLYLWVKDTKPGDTTGDMVGEVWHTAYD